MLVLEEDFHTGLLHFLAGVAAGCTGDGYAFGKNLEGVAFPERLVEGCNGFAVQGHLALGQHVLDACAGLLGQNLEEVGEKGAIVRYFILGHSSSNNSCNSLGSRCMKCSSVPCGMRMVSRD